MPLYNRKRYTVFYVTKFFLTKIHLAVGCSPPVFTGAVQNEQRFLEYISTQESVSRAEVERATGLSPSVTIRALKRLLELELIQKMEIEGM